MREGKYKKTGAAMLSAAIEWFVSDGRFIKIDGSYLSLVEESITTLFGGRITFVLLIFGNKASGYAFSVLIEDENGEKIHYERCTAESKREARRAAFQTANDYMNSEKAKVGS